MISQPKRASKKTSLSTVSAVLKSGASSGPIMKPKLEHVNYHLLREQQIVLMRLRIGHNRLTAHMNDQSQQAPTPNLLACVL